jgi:TonB family protein
MNPTLRLARGTVALACGISLFVSAGCLPSSKEAELQAQIDTLSNEVAELRARLAAQQTRSSAAEQAAQADTLKKIEEARLIVEANLAELELRARRLEEFNEAMFGQVREFGDRAEQIEQGVAAAGTRLDRVEFQFSRQIENVEGRMSTFVEENLARAREFAELRGEVRRLIDAANQPPRLIRSTSPEFPLRLRREGMNGEVELVFVVDEQGNVVDPRVTRSNHSLFSAAALRAVRQWRYAPALQNSQPTAAYVTQVISFRLDDRQGEETKNRTQ